MDLPEIERIWNQHSRPSYWPVTADEMDYIQDLIKQHRPASFIEIGTASGLSGGLICLLLDEYDGKRFVTVDSDKTFFGDNTKENGFLLEPIYPGGKVEVSYLPLTIAADVPSMGETFDMAFVDACHQHPWPLIDTLCLYPVMGGSKVVVQHDLNLYRFQTDKIYGIGPKYLYDQFPHIYRDRSTKLGINLPGWDNYGNIYSVSLDLPIARMEQIAKDGFAIPWSLAYTIPESRLDAIRTVFRTYYDPSLVAVFDKCVDKFNRPI
ncbi:class I SAM-dependent methyltransferase [Mycobacterium paraterrae]|uniref:Class I SAM-dependent methyltransferase n=1 Tax=Mycobacterium paraterrae TaxID=577492 RepID=A0ABY3VP86_9MYCO|nr:class I SAM-dependent methyltransferase [Mycobacterium paraterrae]UMB69017.1 class I SAM-dependent methyltransferase [Mycobacterium paraterrae]